MFDTDSKEDEQSPVPDNMDIANYNNKLPRNHSFSTSAKISRKTFISYPLKHTYIWVSEGNKCKFFRKIFRTY